MPKCSSFTSRCHLAQSLYASLAVLACFLTRNHGSTSRSLRRSITHQIGRNTSVWISDALQASELLDTCAAILHLECIWLYSAAKLRDYRTFQNDKCQVSHMTCCTMLRTMCFTSSATLQALYPLSTFKDPVIPEVIAVIHRAADLNVPGKKFQMLMETFPILAKFPTKIAPCKHGLGGGRQRGHNFSTQSPTKHRKRASNLAYSKFCLSTGARTSCQTRKSRRLREPLWCGERHIRSNPYHLPFCVLCIPRDFIEALGRVGPRRGANSQSAPVRTITTK
ncbi:hypothetical protein NEOLEDRAFT_119300 [Neolentinus lepideus HHB14362 ss-1]|uniref:Uncharacterized protein n=1 Tax=Neolentinus lepideus HHB14362 ss-1 TaxID=1314782 RepID=A0A165MU46_9AGAM|nr:hypothetical protein NEOLEDRAFT_119300 [Neolentinus lepideus HHB14362 ss-1]